MEWFKVDQGLRQVCTLSRDATEGFIKGVRLGKENGDVLLFADNLVLIADSEEFLQMNLKKLDKALTRWEMKMNWENQK